MIIDSKENIGKEIHIEIDELILDGFNHGQGRDMVETIKAELVRLWRENELNNRDDRNAFSSNSVTRTIEQTSHVVESKNPKEMALSTANVIFKSSLPKHYEKFNSE